MIKRSFITSLISLAFAAFLHAETERPKIGLVLGGGGALGLSHIGVLKVLEENNIPIDYIGGTSMGAIVAGMYACGMSPDEIENHFVSLNWWEVLKDRSPHQFLTYRRKIENKRYMGAEFGVNHWKFQFSPGMSHGQKLNNVLETFALNSTGITDFNNLNIPYRAVATDIRSGTSIVLKEGHLATAMRASMAVPGVFTPVRQDDYVLVDGGIFNNIPVDIVKEMGADIIIAVDVGATSAAESAEKEFRSLGEIINRTYLIMQRPDQEKQLTRADIVIAPPLKNATSSQFHLAEKIIPRGRIGAEQQLDALKKLSVDDELYATYLKKQRYQHSRAINITDIEIIGNDDVPAKTIRHRVRTTEGPLDLNSVYEDLAKIHGMGDFQTVTYDLEPNEEGYFLNYLLEEKYWGPNYLHFGVKLESTTDANVLWSLLLNFTMTQLNESGGELKFDIEGGGNKRFLETEWYQPFSKYGLLFFAPSISVSSEDIELFQNNTSVADVEQELYYGQLDAGISGMHFGEVRLGIRGGLAQDQGYSGTNSSAKVSDTVVAITSSLRLDQLDDPILPTSGYQFHLDALHADEEFGADETFSKLELSAMLPFTIGRHTFVPKLAGGTSLGTDLPFYEQFNLGGLNSFAGLAPYELFGDYYGISSLGYRFRLAKLPPTLGNGVYAMGRLDYGNTWSNSSDISFDDLKLGGLAGVVADTIIGTCSLAVGKAESIDALRFYFYLGNKF